MNILVHKEKLLNSSCVKNIKMHSHLGSAYQYENNDILYYDLEGMLFLFGK